MMQSMTFHFGNNATILFKVWHITTAGGMIGSCVAVIGFSLLYELLKTSKEVLLRRHLQRSGGQYKLPRLNYSSSDVDLEAGEEGSHLFGKKKRATLSWPAHLLQTLLFFVQVTLGYSLMMVFMTLNVWLCFSLLFGLTLGYLIFAKVRQSSATDGEDCH